MRRIIRLLGLFCVCAILLMDATVTMAMAEDSSNDYLTIENCPLLETMVESDFSSDDDGRAMLQDSIDVLMASYFPTKIKLSMFIDYYDSEIVKVDGDYTVEDVFILYPGDYENRGMQVTGFIIRNLIEDSTCSYDSFGLTSGDNVEVIGDVFGIDEDTGYILLGNATIMNRSIDNDPIAESSTVLTEEAPTLSEDVRVVGVDIEAGYYTFTCETTYDGYCVVAVFEDSSAYDSFSAEYSFSSGLEAHSKFYKILHPNETYQFQVEDGSYLLIRYGDGTLKESDIGVRASEYTPLQKGDSGEPVRKLQQRLIDLLYLTDGKTDGDFGNKTKTAVEKFQSAVDLPITGIADGITQAILYSETAPEAKFSASCSSVVIGNSATASWYVDGHEFTLKGNQTKTIETVWGTYRFDAYGEYEKIGE